MPRTEVKRTDELAEIEGIKPKVLLNDGCSLEATSQSSDKTYTMKRTGDHYYCTCPSWRQAGGPVNGRTCKHLQSLLGLEYEEARMELKNPSAPKGRSSKTSKIAKKRKADDTEDEVEEEIPAKKGKTAKAAVKPQPKSKASQKEEEEEDTEESVDEKPSKGKEVAKRASPDGDDDEEDDEEKPVSKKTRNTKAASKSKVVSDEDLEDKRSTRPKRKVEPVKKLKDTSFKPLLAEKWDLEKGRDPTGYLISEKLDGVRAYWNGKTFLSREGNPFYAPEWFTKRMPQDITFDGELFTTRGGFQDCVSIVRTQNNPDAWKFTVTYKIFDCPSMADEPFEDRIEFCKKTFDKLKIRWVSVLEHTVCKGNDHVLEMLDEVCEKGGEGLMLREPGSLYINGRSKTLLKVKRFFDADAIVRAHERGSGKNSNCTGALRVEMLDAETRKPTGKMFKIGTGLTDKQRRNPPKIGSIVIYRYQELSRSGTPRFPSYVGERAD